MRYSVFDWNRRQYRVYEDAREAPVMGDPPDCRPGVPSYMGMIDVSGVLCELPRDARFVGMSTRAVGRLSRLPGGRMAGVPHGEMRRGVPSLGGIPGLGAAPRCTCGASLGNSFSESDLGQITSNVVSLTASGLLTGWLSRKLGIG